MTLRDLLRELSEEEEESGEDERPLRPFWDADSLVDLFLFFSLALCLLLGLGDLCFLFFESDSDLCFFFLELFFLSLREGDLLSDLPLSFFFFFFFCLGDGERELLDSRTRLYCFCCSCCLAAAAAASLALRLGSNELPST